MWVIFDRKLKVGSCHGMVWSGKVCRISGSSFYGWWIRGRSIEKLWPSQFPQGLSLTHMCLPQHTHTLHTNKILSGTHYYESIYLLHFSIFNSNLVCQTNNKQVHNAGHMVPMDQPKASLEMLRRWTRGKLSQAPADAQKLFTDQ